MEILERKGYIVSVEEARKMEKMLVVGYFTSKYIDESEGFIELDEIDSYLEYKLATLFCNKISVTKDDGEVKIFYNTLTYNESHHLKAEVVDLFPLTIKETDIKIHDLSFNNHLLYFDGEKLVDVTQDDIHLTF